MDNPAGLVPRADAIGTEHCPFQCRCGSLGICTAQQQNIALFYRSLWARRGPAQRTAVDHVPG